MTGPITLSTEERRARMKMRAEAVIKHYPIPDDDDADAKPWTGGMMDSRLLADEVLAYLAATDQPPEIESCAAQKSAADNAALRKRVEELERAITRGLADIIAGNAKAAVGALSDPLMRTATKA